MLTLNKFRFIYESVISNDKEYFDAVSLHYTDDVIDNIKMGEEYAKIICDGEIQTYKSNNTIIRWCENNNILIILGTVSVTGKIHRTELNDFNNWINVCVDKINDGITVMSSVNDLSEPLLNKIIKECNKKNIELNINIQNSYTDKISGKNWKTYIIHKKK